MEANEGAMSGAPEDFLQTRYAPATGWADSDVQMTTDELARSLTEHTGAVHLASEVYAAMKAAGYLDDTLDGSRYVWLMKRVAPQQRIGAAS